MTNSTTYLTATLLVGDFDSTLEIDFDDESMIIHLPNYTTLN